ncbi:hypothetical protein Acr_00g0056060 [Actinidia rufa]|uniref:Uncharacterized protein n=1 Tax=Actinidia rufa TaxID=165716 RepID=A0A7J0DMD2_9ERIC|nr:hypothetical protein Acr_00g0056060 [Actinidia rufa]
MENAEIRLYPETEFLYSKEGTGNEWECEAVEKNGRLLNDAIKIPDRPSTQEIPPPQPKEDLTENRWPARSFGTVLARGETRNQITESSDFSRKEMQQDRAGHIIGGATASACADVFVDEE